MPTVVTEERKNWRGEGADCRLDISDDAITIIQLFF